MMETDFIQIRLLGDDGDGFHSRRIQKMLDLTQICFVGDLGTGLCGIHLQILIGDGSEPHLFLGCSQRKWA